MEQLNNLTTDEFFSPELNQYLSEDFKKSFKNANIYVNNEKVDKNSFVDMYNNDIVVKMPECDDVEMQFFLTGKFNVNVGDETILSDADKIDPAYIFNNLGFMPRRFPKISEEKEKNITQNVANFLNNMPKLEHLNKPDFSTKSLSTQKHI